MSKEQIFLVTYGLHNFVTHDRTGATPGFCIRSKEGLTMTRHAKGLIEDSFGDATEIHVV